MRWLVMLGLSVMLMVCPLQAQQKPIGIFNPKVNHLDELPAWVSFGNVIDWDSNATFTQYAQHSERTGFKWILHIANIAPTGDLTAHAKILQQRLITTRLLPHIAGVMYGEEWYEQYKAGDFISYGLKNDPEVLLENITIVRDFLGWKFGELKAVFHLPIFWVTTYVNPDPQKFGAIYYAPIPQHVDVIGLDAYTKCGRTFTDVELVWELALTSTTLPFIIIPQWFQTMDGGMWDCGMPPGGVQGYDKMFKHPRVLAMMGFDWHDRTTLKGLESLPTLRKEIEQTLK